ncbi:MAG TPA: phytanoyl-CoA dioxygenase family protein [Chthonomonadaceae bacterium]|nr:phytanoyl-CoA dioxygenase family protein [Chthonomonadaceae bacterium]
MDQEMYRRYAANGYHVERGVFTAEEVGQMLAHYMAMRAEGPHPGDSAGVPAHSRPDAPDPWKQYPRMIQMHHWDALTRQWMSDPRLTDVVAALMGQRPKLIQTMVYFKPPGGRGQSFHQDNIYLRTTPLLAAWVALDRADAENGAMEMVRGSHLLGLLPLREADTDISVTEIETVIPSYLPRDLMALEPGDAVLFGGLTIHGSLPNRSRDRFRRAFICHYAGAEAYPIVAPSLSLDAEAK